MTIVKSITASLTIGYSNRHVLFFSVFVVLRIRKKYLFSLLFPRPHPLFPYVFILFFNVNQNSIKILIGNDDQSVLTHRTKSLIDDTNNLQVIGVGLPRTGTTSLQTALELLGFGPCHHMTELLAKREQAEAYTNLLDGGQVDLRTVLKDYRSSVDVPNVLFYKELHRLYPKAKLILTVRDSDEEWFECFQNSIAPIWFDTFFFVNIYPLRNLRRLCRVARKIGQKFVNDYGQMGPHIHRLHNAKIQNEIKAENLLIFKAKEGWEPLCRFLQVPIPQDTPFPCVNHPGYVKNRLRLARFVGSLVWIGFIGFLVVIFRFLVS